MKNKYLKELVEKLKQLDARMTKTEVKFPSAKPCNDLSEFEKLIRDFNSAFEEHGEKTSKALEYLTNRIALSIEEEEILKTLLENPDNFLKIETKFFNDYGFIAQAIEIASDAYAKKAVVWTKNIAKDLKKDGARLESSFKESVDGQNSVFAIRVKLKCDREYKKLAEQKRQGDEQLSKGVDDIIKTMQEFMNNKVVSPDGLDKK